ncbi:MAG: hypothetical protein H9535_19680 [Ignavibacteria bacterium]|nr:hypothetical protein [Ignavibacteria bacterium]
MATKRKLKYFPNYSDYLEESIHNEERDKLREAFKTARDKLDLIAASPYVEDFKVGKTANNFVAPDPLPEFEKLFESKVGLNDADINRFNGYKDFEAGRVIYQPKEEWLMDELEKALIKYAKKQYPYPKCKNNIEGAGRRKQSPTQFNVYVTYNLIDLESKTKSKK